MKLHAPLCVVWYLSTRSPRFGKARRHDFLQRWNKNSLKFLVITSNRNQDMVNICRYHDISWLSKTSDIFLAGESVCFLSLPQGQQDRKRIHQMPSVWQV